MYQDFQYCQDWRDVKRFWHTVPPPRIHKDYESDRVAGCVQKDGVSVRRAVMCPAGRCNPPPVPPHPGHHPTPRVGRSCRLSCEPRRRCARLSFQACRRRWAQASKSCPARICPFASALMVLSRARVSCADSRRLGRPPARPGSRIRRRATRISPCTVSCSQGRAMGMCGSGSMSIGW